MARLRAENARLLRLLKLTPQQAAPPGAAQAAYFEVPPGIVDDGSPPDAKVAFYAALFAARTDVYATRFDNPRTGKRGITVYGNDAARPEAVEDLRQRAATFRAKLTATPLSSQPKLSPLKQQGLETLNCIDCGRDFQRARVRGRKPVRCPNCRHEAGGEDGPMEHPPTAVA